MGVEWNGPCAAVCVDEGIDELAAFLGKGEEVAEMTSKAMGGDVSFRDALEMRLQAGTSIVLIENAACNETSPPPPAPELVLFLFLLFLFRHRCLT